MPAFCPNPQCGVEVPELYERKCLRLGKDFSCPFCNTIVPLGQDGNRILPPRALEDWAPADRFTSALVFTGIVGTAELERRIGEEDMRAAVKAHLTRARELIGLNRGALCNDVADRLLTVFHDVGPALDFVFALRSSPGDSRIEIKSCIHVGAAKVDGSGLIGKEVLYASGILKRIGEKGEVWLSTRAKEDLDWLQAQRFVHLEWEKRKRKLDIFGQETLWTLVGESRIVSILSSELVMDSVGEPHEGPLAALGLETSPQPTDRQNDVYHSPELSRVGANPPSDQDSWSDLREGAERQFCFLSVDVVGHSGLSRRHAKKRVDKVLCELRALTRRTCEFHHGKEFNWGGDGGMFWFFEGYPWDDSVSAGTSILAEIPNFNRTIASTALGEDIAIRVVCHLGLATYHRDHGDVRSRELNFLAKHERDLGSPNRLAITHAVYRELEISLKQLFSEAHNSPLKVIEDGGQVTIPFLWQRDPD